jgi:hypothetical protein
MIARTSSADGRERHRGISHHTRTALALVPAAVDVALPPELAEAADTLAPHRVHVIDPGDVATLLAAAELQVTTMGRGPHDDPLFFRSVAAAALLAARSATADGTVCAE